MARGLEFFAEVRCRGRTREQVRGSAGVRGAGRAQAEGAPADRRRHTSGTPGLLTLRPSPVLLLSPSTRQTRLEAELLCQVVVFRDVVVGLTRGRAVGGTSGPLSGQMFPGRLPATYLTWIVGDEALGRIRTGPEPGRAAVRIPGVVFACVDKRRLGQ